MHTLHTTPPGIPRIFHEELPTELSIELAHQFCTAYRVGEHPVLDGLCDAMKRDFVRRGIPAEALPDAMQSDMAAMVRSPSAELKTGKPNVVLAACKGFAG